jgi:alkylation response protein AidB-like acyl-CoA dehydrogenase
MDRDMSPTDLDTMLLESVRAVVRDRVAPRAAEIDRSGEFPEDIRKLFSELGLLGLTIPEEYGGVGATLRLSVDLIAEIAFACVNSANIVTQQALGAAPILFAASSAQKSRWLPDLATGQHLGSFALTEPGAGSDNRGMRTVFKRVDGGYRLTGNKVFITWGSIAHVMTVFGREGSATDGRPMAAVLELPTPGFQVLRLEEKMGMSASPTTQVAFDDVFVPDENVLVSDADGLKIALSSLNPGRIHIGALSLGLARGALDFATRYLVQRKQFGQRLSDFQGLRFKVADHATHIEAAYQLLLTAATSFDEDRADAAKLCAMAKLFATDVAMEVTTDAVGLLGGYGYLKDYPVERMMRDAKVMQIVEGTNEIQRVVIARRVFEDVGG